MSCHDNTSIAFVEQTKNVLRKFDVNHDGESAQHFFQKKERKKIFKNQMKILSSSYYEYGIKY